MSLENYIGKDLFQFVNQNFWHQLIDNITKTDRAKVRSMSKILNFRDKDNVSEIGATIKDAIIEEIEYDLGYFISHNMLVGLVEVWADPSGAGLF